MATKSAGDFTDFFCHQQMLGRRDELDYHQPIQKMRIELIEPGKMMVLNVLNVLTGNSCGFSQAKWEVDQHQGLKMVI